MTTTNENGAVDLYWQLLVSSHWHETTDWPGLEYRSRGRRVGSVPPFGWIDPRQYYPVDAGRIVAICGRQGWSVATGRIEIRWFQPFCLLCFALLCFVLLQRETNQRIKLQFVLFLISKTQNDIPNNRPGTNERQRPQQQQQQQPSRFLASSARIAPSTTTRRKRLSMFLLSWWHW